MREDGHLYAGIEGGGTKFIVAVGTADGKIREESRIPTTTPKETLGRCVDFLKQATGPGTLSAIGMATFGPVDVREHSATYGQVLPTPKPGWAGADLLAPFRDAFGVPIALDTDVNGAALGELRWGAAQGLETFLYFTIGTGVGGGGIVKGQPIHGLLHPEMGHIALPKEEGHSSVCAFHDDCFEGLASGPSIEKRWGEKAENLPANHPAWDLEARYIACAMRAFICTLSPERIILGGGVMAQAHLFPMIREKTLAQLNGYVQVPEILQDIDHYIVPPALEGKAGILGALALARQADQR